jgi:molybdate transport system substrate-binding protein
LAVPRLLAVALATGLALSGCGDRSVKSRGNEEQPSGELTVAAAASLTTALEDYGRRFAGPRVRHSFAGSDELAAQIRQGARPDVYAAADTELPEALAREGLVERPVAFATNRLVVAVPTGSPIRSLDGLGRPGTDLVIGSPSVPIGSYTQAVLTRLDPARRRAILANVRSGEPDVKGVVGKLTRGAADAGLVYRSEVAAAGNRLQAIELPRELRPQVAYGAAVVRGTRNPGAARRYLAGLSSGAGAAALRAQGFGPPP